MAYIHVLPLKNSLQANPQGPDRTFQRTFKWKKRNGRLPLLSLICIPSYISLSWEQNLFLPQQIVMCRTRRLSSCYVHSSWGKGQRSKDGTYQVPLWQRRSFNVICINIQTAVKYFNVNSHCNQQGNLSSNYLVLLPGYAT